MAEKCVQLDHQRRMKKAEMLELESQAHTIFLGTEGARGTREVPNKSRTVTIHSILQTTQL
jgi:hypothetical protein